MDTQVARTFARIEEKSMQNTDAYVVTDEPEEIPSERGAAQQLEQILARGLPPRPKRTARWPERWIIHRADGSFALYLVNREIPSAAKFLPSVIRIPELTVPQVLTAVTSPPSVNEGAGFWSGCTHELPHMETKK
jgi:hypothetical protein